ncbi:hypothetical protein DEU56DRAFT_355139 [Suillus clintonianus]|uniref:uncharacterized protein n=1 Tax=Suillus clintonianus TaxID=1904413 RepID=UPI001B85C4D6|nr:uncharacterized protein DEU56DRAFT_355139 [Suillus clintonianus]KAG2137083.1 hypothetical protein DEU56DRAFT_355139 [Suillus clintonianus]
MTQPWPFQAGTQLSDTPESDLASLSPRTALLSPPYENAELSRPRRVNGAPNDKFRHERERIHATASARDLLRLLVNEEYEAKQTRKVLYTALDRLDAESRRAEEAEVQLADTLERTRSINEARVAAQQEAARAQEELRLYKLQLDNAQREILRAQDVLGVIEAQRDDAEAAAAEARSKARRLNEERLIDLAREEGRRLGYEEGIRRGRNMGYREGRVGGLDEGRSQMRDAAAATLDRLLDAREGEDAASVVMPPQPASMPESRTAPEVLRVSSPISTSLGGRHGSRSRHDSESDSASRRSVPRAPDPIVMPVMVEHPRTRTTSTNPSVTTQSSRSRPELQPWPMSDRSSARSPPTRPISLQNSAPSVQHSEFQVPPDGYIPTLGQDQRIPLPPPHELNRIPSPSPSQPVAGPSSDSVRTFDYPPRRASPESQTSTKMSMSQSSTISALEIIGLPNMTSRDKRRERNGLSVIHEDASATADYETVTGSDAGHHHYRSERDNDSEATRHSKQRLADELRWSNPSEPEEWRRHGAAKTRTQSSQGPPRPRPTNVTTPNPLSPPNWDNVDAPLPRHSRHSRTVSTPSQRESAGYEHRRVVSSDSSVPEITVEPPSRPPSDAPSGRAAVLGLLSPDHANHPLPVPVPVSQRTPLVPTVPNTPVSAPGSLVGSFYDIGQLPTGYAGNSGAPPPGGPVIPNMNGREAPSRRSSLYAPAQPDGRRSKTPQSYVSSPVPSGFSYPAPPISREPTPNGSAERGDRSSTHGRRQSLSQMAGMTPGARPRSLQPGGGGGESSRSSHKQRSNASDGSRQSFAHYDPGVYNDPSYLSSTESFMDHRTGANTAANAGGSRRTS